MKSRLGISDIVKINDVNSRDRMIKVCLIDFTFISVSASLILEGKKEEMCANVGTQ